MLTSSLVESLLYQSEGTALDFKRAQYPFSGANEEQRSELLKDILAFSNSWRETEARIVIGVEAVIGGKHIPVGTEDHFDDAQLQQFVNSKTNRRIELAYEVHLHEGKKVGIIRIPKQERPNYATKRFGKVDKGVVYYRLGSSTTVASPEEIAQMGRDSSASDTAPVLNLQFVNYKTREELGDSIALSSIAYAAPKTPLPDLKSSKTERNTGIYGLNLNLPEPVSPLANPDYWREKEEFVRLNNLLNPVAFLIQNQSGTLAKNVRVETVGSSLGQITIASELPDKPEYQNIAAMTRNSYLFHLAQQQKPQVEVVHHGEQWTLTFHFGNVQPKSYAWAYEPFYIGSGEKEFLELEAMIYADNLPTPQKVNLAVNFTVDNRPSLKVDDLRLMPPYEK